MGSGRLGQRRVGWLAVFAAMAVGVVGTTKVDDARGDGLPVLGVDVGPAGIARPDGTVRFATFAVGDSTLVTKTAVAGGAVTQHVVLPGRYTIPAVAYDGSADGLTASGEQLVLIEPRQAFPRTTTTFRVLDTGTLRQVGKRIVLSGDFSFDAISPDGATMYLINYTSPTNPEQYDVRAYDIATRRLVPGPIVDPAEPDEKMVGAPVTRVASPDGRWQYTLYATGEPFVHALDTVERTARCIDLPSLVGKDAFAQAMRRSAASNLLIGPPGQAPEIEINTRTFTVAAPKVVRVAPAPHSSATRLVIGSVVAAVVAAAFGFALLRRRTKRGATGMASPG